MHDRSEPVLWCWSAWKGAISQHQYRRCKRFEETPHRSRRNRSVLISQVSIVSIEKSLLTSGVDLRDRQTYSPAHHVATSHCRDRREDSARGRVGTSCLGYTDDELGIARKACCSGVVKASNVYTPLLALSRLQTNARNGHGSKDRLKIVCPLLRSAVAQVSMGRDSVGSTRRHIPEQSCRYCHTVPRAPRYRILLFQ